MKCTYSGAFTARAVGRRRSRRPRHTRRTITTVSEPGSISRGVKVEELMCRSTRCSTTRRRRHESETRPRGALKTLFDYSWIAGQTIFCVGVIAAPMMLVVWLIVWGLKPSAGEACFWSHARMSSTIVSTAVEP